MRSPYQRASKRRPPPSRRRALELLASCPDGCSETFLLVQGFSGELLLGLVHGGLVSVSPEQAMAGDKQIEIARVRITDAGLRVLGNEQQRAPVPPLAD